MEAFSKRGATMLAAMSELARAQNAKGVALVARLDSDGGWESHMKVVDTLALIPTDAENHQYPGYNFLAIAYSKAAEMVHTKRNSGSQPERPVLQGEFGYSGGVIEPFAGGWILAVFSGASGDLDTEISRKGLEAYGRH